MDLILLASDVRSEPGLAGLALQRALSLCDELGRRISKCVGSRSMGPDRVYCLCASPPLL